MLLNIDKPNRTSVLHDELCTFVPKPHGTDLKPVGSFGRDGGWFSVTSVGGAKAVAEREFPKAVFKLCARCQKTEPTSGR